VALCGINLEGKAMIVEELIQPKFDNFNSQATKDLVNLGPPTCWK
jgi:hypothetical protein